MDRPSRLFRHHADHPVFDIPDEPANHEPPGMTKLFIFTHPVVSTAILMVGLVVATLVSA